MTATAYARATEWRRCARSQRRSAALRDVLPVAADGRDHDVGVRLVHRRPVREVVGRVHRDIDVEHDLLELGEDRVLLGEHLPGLLVRGRPAGLLPLRHLAVDVVQHGAQHLLGERLPLLGDGLGDRPAPDLVPGEGLLAPRPNRELGHADVAGDARPVGVVELAPMGGIDQREGRIARHEDGVRLLAAVGGHAGRADLVLVDGVPPVLDDLLVAGVRDRGLPVVVRQDLVVALVDRLEDVALVGPHRPPEAEPGGVHLHGADVAPFDLAFLLEALRDLDQLLEGGRHLVLGDQIGAIEEGADRVRHRHHGHLAVVVDEGVQRVLVDLVHPGHVVGRLDPLLPQLAPVVIVPDDVELVGARGEGGRHLLLKDAVGHGDLGELDVVRLGPFLHHGDVGFLDRLLHVADLELGLRRRRRRPAHVEKGQRHAGATRPQPLREGHDISPAFCLRCIRRVPAG
jgi:hypothetical protein